jgi:P pilus assembly chaperone PapD
MTAKRLRRAARCFALSLGIVMAAAAAHAQVSVSPTSILFDGEPGTKAITVTNTGPREQVYRVSLINLRMQPDGRMVRAEAAEEGEHFAADMVRYTPREVALAAGGSEVVRFQVGNLPAGEYRTHVLVQQVPDVDALDAPPFARADGVALDLRAVFGVAIPLIIRMGDLPTTVAFGAARITTLPDGTPAVALTLERSGARSVRGEVVIRRGGEEIALYDGIAIYAPATRRDLLLPLKLLGVLQAREGSLNVRFQEPEEVHGAVAAEAEIRAR